MKDWNALYQYMSGYLKENLPAHLAYHHWGHTVHVINTAEIIARREGLPEEDILLIKTGALFHDAGYISGPENHEARSIEMAARLLPAYGYTTDELNRITGLIRATAIPQNPKNLPECVLADADLEYLGADYYKEMADTLYAEFKHFHPSLTLSQWKKNQADFLSKHRYHTEYCQQHRKAVKQYNLQTLLDEIEADNIK